MAGCRGMGTGGGGKGGIVGGRGGAVGGPNMGGSGGAVGPNMGGCGGAVGGAIVGDCGGAVGGPNTGGRGGAVGGPIVGGRGGGANGGGGGDGPETDGGRMGGGGPIGGVMVPDPCASSAKSLAARVRGIPPPAKRNVLAECGTVMTTGVRTPVCPTVVAWAGRATGWPCSERDVGGDDRLVAVRCLLCAMVCSFRLTAAAAPLQPRKSPSQSRNRRYRGDRRI